MLYRNYIFHQKSLTSWGKFVRRPSSDFSFHIRIFFLALLAHWCTKAEMIFFGLIFTFVDNLKLELILDEDVMNETLV